MDYMALPDLSSWSWGKRKAEADEDDSLPSLPSLPAVKKLRRQLSSTRATLKREVKLDSSMRRCNKTSKHRSFIKLLEDLDVQAEATLIQLPGLPDLPALVADEPLGSGVQVAHSTKGSIHDNLKRGASPKATLPRKRIQCGIQPHNGGELRGQSALQETMAAEGTPAVKGVHGFIHRPSSAVMAKSPRVMMELCAGTCRVAKSFTKKGWRAESFEITRSTDEDILAAMNTSMIHSRVISGTTDLIFIGMTCASFTTARRGKRGPGRPGFPPPLRDDSDAGIYGLPGLSPADALRVLAGNELAKWTAELIELCIKHKTVLVMENPQKSRIWKFPPIKSLLPQASSSDDFDHCQHGAEWRKRTKLVSWGKDMSGAFPRCQMRKGCCSASGKPHVELSGIGVQGKQWRTAEGSAYPVGFCDHFASLF